MTAPDNCTVLRGEWLQEDYDAVYERTSSRRTFLSRHCGGRVAGRGSAADGNEGKLNLYVGYVIVTAKENPQSSLPLLCVCFWFIAASALSLRRGPVTTPAYVAKLKCFTSPTGVRIISTWILRLNSHPRRCTEREDRYHKAHHHRHHPSLSLAGA